MYAGMKPHSSPKDSKSISTLQSATQGRKDRVPTVQNTLIEVSRTGSTSNIHWFLIRLRSGPAKTDKDIFHFLCHDPAQPSNNP